MNKLIHHIAVAYLALIMLARMMAMPISLLDYSINNNYISTTLCENSSRPEIHCFGKCYLNKKLAAANENQESQNQKGNIKTIVVDFFEQPGSPVFGCTRDNSSRFHQINPQTLSDIFIGNIFHPPIV